MSRTRDPGDPFDVAAFRDGGSDDAVPIYQQSLARYQAPPKRPPPGSSTPIYNSVVAVRFQSAYASPDVLAWIASNREARDLWLRTTERPGVRYHPWDGRGFGDRARQQRGPRYQDRKTCVPAIDDLDRGMLRWLGEHEAARLEHAGDLAGAWTWHNAALRYSRHVGTRTIFADRLQGVLLHRAACERVEAWAADDQVDAAMLRRALVDAQAVGAMTPPLSDAIKADYLEAMLLLDHPPLWLVNRVLDDFRSEGETPHSEPPWPRPRSQWGRGNDGFEDQGDRFQRYLPDLPAQATYYFNGEPERSKRLVRQAYANWLTYCDLPLSQQPRTTTKFHFFVDPPGVFRQRLPAAALAEELNLPGPARHVLPRLTELQQALRDEQSAQARFIVTLAEELYCREHGKRPSSARELVGVYLDELPEGFVERESAPQYSEYRSGQPAPPLESQP